MAGLRLFTLVIAGAFSFLMLSSPALADRHMMDRNWQERMMQERGMMGGYMGEGGMGMMHGGGMMGGGMAYMLDLDEKQRNQIRELQRTQRKANWQRMGEMIDLQYELQTQYDKDKPDAKAVSNVYDKIHALRKQMIESQIETRNKMRDVLTKEQQEKFDSFRHGMGYGGMGMMGGGMGMMPMMGGMDMME